MFESAELGHEVDKATYKAEVPHLREALLEAQFDLLESARFPVIILIAGLDAAGKGETVNTLNEWMDPRHIETHAYGPESEEEAQRPHMWRYWQALPRKGKIGIHFGAWYNEPLLDRVYDKLKQAGLAQAMEEIARFERMLIDEGALILKFWLHLSRDKQKTRMKKLESDPLTRWRVTEQDREHLKIYDKFRSVSEQVLRQSSSAGAPWVIVEGYDDNYRSLAVGKHILHALRARLDDPAEKPPVAFATMPGVATVDSITPLSRLDLNKKLADKEYETELERYQGRLNKLTRDPAFRKRSVICVFEGPDAAGKGGSIRRITAAVDARLYSIVPIAAPTEEERAQPYLWRFWRHVPMHGRMVIFDRSWYGRVLVERVEGFCSEHDWMRAYGEINDFEDQLARHDCVVAKFWLQISPEEQLLRFEERQKISYKRFKITPDDWRNRDKWAAYQTAACDMIDRTSTDRAPWSLIEANDKNHARIKILKTLCERIEAAF